MTFEIWEDDLGFTLIPKNHSQKLTNPQAIFCCEISDPKLTKSFEADSWEEAVDEYNRVIVFEIRNENN